MGKVAILTDSNSGITQAQSKELGVKVIPMPFFIDGEQYFEDINLTRYRRLMSFLRNMMNLYIFLCQAGSAEHVRQLLWLLMIMMERFRLSITREFL